MSRFNRNNVISGRYKIVDAYRVVVLLVMSVGIPIFITIIAPLNERVTGYEKVIYFSCLVLFGILLFKIAMINAKGYVVNVEADTLEYPSGLFKRSSLVVSEIRGVSVSSKTTRRMTNGKTGSNTTYYLDINGEFGAIQFSFLTRGKRDELHSLLVLMNRMGNPILNR